MKVSIVIPAFGEERLLHRSLATLAPQRDEFIECIVVDDGSDPPLTVPNWVHLVRIDRPKAHRGSSAAKNLGAKHAIGDWLIFTDSDFLHSPDAVGSLKDAARYFRDALGDKFIINTARFEIPKGYPEFEPERLQEFLDMAEMEERLSDVKLEVPMLRCWEQNFSIINRAFFWSIGGYDEIGFPSWGFNNHDLCMRILGAGGYVTSTVKRRSNGKRLICVHQYHDNGVPNRDQANAEFAAKWGQPFYHTMPQDLFGRPLEEYTGCQTKK